MKKEIKKKRKKHEHDLMDEPCPNCGYQEGYCLKCNKYLYTDDGGKTYHIA